MLVGRLIAVASGCVHAFRHFCLTRFWVLAVNGGVLVGALARLVGSKRRCSFDCFGKAGDDCVLVPRVLRALSIRLKSRFCSISSVLTWRVRSVFTPQRCLGHCIQASPPSQRARGDRSWSWVIKSLIPRMAGITLFETSCSRVFYRGGPHQRMTTDTAVNTFCANQPRPRWVGSGHDELSLTT